MAKSAKLDRQRYDRNGNIIATQIGTFSTANRRALLKSRELMKSQNSDTGSAEHTPTKETKGEEEPSSPYGRKKKHKVTFMDDVSGDKKALTDVHMIESYKKYNQDFYVESPGQGCCMTF